jgi:hypothetical protein
MLVDQGKEFSCIFLFTFFLFIPPGKDSPGGKDNFISKPFTPAFVENKKGAVTITYDAKF